MRRRRSYTRSSPTTWISASIKTIGTRKYYAVCKYENQIYSIGDAVLLNAIDEPLPIGQIVAMWEQGKKKWLTINWFYRATDLQRPIEKRLKSILKAKDSPEEDVTTINRNIKKKGKAPPKKKSDPAEEDTLKDTFDYISKMKPQEILVSNHRDYNYPSTLICKITVKHMDEIENMEKYQKRNKNKYLFYKKHVDLSSFKLTNAKPTDHSPSSPTPSKKRKPPSSANQPPWKRQHIHVVKDKDVDDPSIEYDHNVGIDEIVNKEESISCPNSTWSILKVTSWLLTLKLSEDYSKLIQDNVIDGEVVLSLKERKDWMES